MSSAAKLIENTNRFWNSAIAYKRNKGVVSGDEAIRNGGDCNDYVVSKGDGLIQSKIPPERLRVAIGKTTDTQQLHSVLLVDPGDGTEPLVLDNRTDDIVPLSEVRDMQVLEQFDYQTFRQDRRQPKK